MVDINKIEYNDFDDESINKFNIQDLENESLDLKQDQNEWIRQQLADLWGENKAEYFLNPSIVAHSQEDDSIKDTHLLTDNNKLATSSFSHKHNRHHNQGMFAYTIWDNIRSESKQRAKHYDLPKELQEKMDTFLNSSKLKSSLNANNKQQLLASSKAVDQELAKHSRIIDMTRLNKTKITRNEIELMYRSSKMNEEKMMLMRTNSPLPDLNDAEGKESIVRYLPPINLNDDVTKQINNSLIEFESSSNRQKKLNIKNNETTTFNLIDTKLDNTNNNNNKLKYETVKLHFLAEKPHTDYLLNRTNNNNNSNTNDKSNNNINNEFNDTILSQIEDLDKMTTPIHNHAPPPTMSGVSNKFENSNDSKSDSSYPPLTMNALMEYKPLLKAPGIGDFDNGRPKLFRYNNK